MKLAYHKSSFPSFSATGSYFHVSGLRFLKNLFILNRHRGIFVDYHGSLNSASHCWRIFPGMASIRSCAPYLKSMFAVLLLFFRAVSFLGCQYRVPLSPSNFHGLSEAIQKEMIEFCDMLSFKWASYPWVKWRYYCHYFIGHKCLVFIKALNVSLFQGVSLYIRYHLSRINTKLSFNCTVWWKVGFV